jgi:hypothetical protein
MSTCPEGRTSCGGTCVDLATNRDNCGACDRRCAEQQSCVNRNCVCPMGTSLCEGRCVNLTNDKQNCGECGNVCKGPRSCVASMCVMDGAL